MSAVEVWPVESKRRREACLDNEYCKYCERDAPGAADDYQPAHRADVEAK